MSKICNRCGKSLEEEKFTDGALYTEHEVCEECRKFMDERLKYLVECDRKFHEGKKKDYEITKKYLRRLTTNEESLCEHINEFGFRCRQKKVKGKKYCYWHEKMKEEKEKSVFASVEEIRTRGI